jgi:hypothetical protein
LTTLAAAIGLVGLVLMLGGILTWLNHEYPQNYNEVVHYPYVSPDGTHKAVVFHRVGKGANTITTHVKILGNEESLGTRPGNAYIATGDANISVDWVDAHHLVISAPKETEVVLRAATVGDVIISGH